MIVLQDERILVRLDPRHGGEVVDLVDLSSGRQLLARTPWSTATPRDEELSEDDWVAGYRGGWQVLLPNAGAGCRIGETEHGFHGRASIAGWEVLAEDDRAAALRWEGHGLRATRQMAVEDGALAVETVLECLTSEPVPCVMVEHVACGVELLHPRAELTMPAAIAYELDASGGPLAPPAGAPRWPGYLSEGGSERSFGDPELSQVASVMIALHDVPDGGAAVRNPATGQGLAIAWDPSWYRHMWLWHEARSIGDGWRHLTEILALEPATVPHAAGLAAAVDARQAAVVQPGDPRRTWFVARPFVADARIESVDTAGRPSTTPVG